MAGYGYIRRRGKTHRGTASWNVQVDLGRDPSTGRRRRRVFTVSGTKKDAQHALTAALRERDLGNDTDAGTLTVAEYLRDWLRDGAAQRVAPSTLERYRQIVEQHLVPALGGHRLRELRPQHIDAAYAGFRRRDGRGSELSPKTVFEHHAVLRAALNRAVKKGLLARNPVQQVDAPRPGRREMRVLTAEEAQRLLAAAAGTRYHAILYMAARHRRPDWRAAGPALAGRGPGARDDADHAHSAVLQGRGDRLRAAEDRPLPPPRRPVAGSGRGTQSSPPIR